MTLDRYLYEIANGFDALSGTSVVDYNSTPAGSFNRIARATEQLSLQRAFMPINSARYGLVADGVEDNSSAFLDMMMDLPEQVPLFDGYRMPMPEIQLPPGVIRITASGLLSAIGEVGRAGYKMRGHGQGTIIWLDPDGTSTVKWLFNNEGTRRLAYCIFEDIVFSGGDTWQGGNPVTDAGTGYTNIDSYVKGFKFTGPGTDDCHLFRGCEFRFFEQVAEWAGSNNADTTVFTGCKYNKNKDQFLVNNAQSMSIQDIGGSSVNYGSYLKYTANGGGNFAKYGGAIIMLVVEGADVAADRYVVDTSLGGPSGGNAVNLISGVRVELRGEYGKLAKMTADLVSTFKFDTCSLTNTSTADKTVVDIGGSQRLTFQDCQIHDQSTGASRFQITSAARRGVNPHLIFRGCMLPSTIHEDIVWNGGFGRLTIDALCAQNTVGAAQTAVAAIACDILGTTVSNSVSNRTKTRNEIPLANNATILAAGTYSVVLPPGVEIHEVWAKYAAGHASASNVMIHIGNGDKTVTYASSPLAAFSAGNSIKAQIMVNTGAVLNDRTVRIWLSNGDGVTAPSTSINVAPIAMRSGVVYS